MTIDKLTKLGNGQALVLDERAPAQIARISDEELRESVERALKIR